MPGKDGPERFIAPILFLDIAGFSDLKERELRCYLQHVLPEISEQAVDRYRDDLLELNTWGDAIVAVARDPFVIAHLALDLRDYFNNKNWSDVDIDKNLRCRIALHAGVVFMGPDPLRRKQHAVIGTEVNIAARIEPVTEPGQIWVTENFKNNCVTRTDSKLVFEYIGRRKLAKNVGPETLYRLWRKTDAKPPLRDQEAFSTIDSAVDDWRRYVAELLPIADGKVSISPNQDYIRLLHSIIGAAYNDGWDKYKSIVERILHRIDDQNCSPEGLAAQLCVTAADFHDLWRDRDIWTKQDPPDELVRKARMVNNNLDNIISMIAQCSQNTREHYDYHGAIAWCMRGIVALRAGKFVLEKAVTNVTRMMCLQRAIEDFACALKCVECAECITPEDRDYHRAMTCKLLGDTLCVANSRKKDSPGWQEGLKYLHQSHDLWDRLAQRYYEAHGRTASFLDYELALSRIALMKVDYLEKLGAWVEEIRKLYRAGMRYQSLHKTLTYHFEPLEKKLKRARKII